MPSAKATPCRRQQQADADRPVPVPDAEADRDRAGAPAVAMPEQHERHARFHGTYAHSGRIRLDMMLLKTGRWPRPGPSTVADGRDGDRGSDLKGGTHPSIVDLRAGGHHGSAVFSPREVPEGGRSRPAKRAERNPYADFLRRSPCSSSSSGTGASPSWSGATRALRHQSARLHLQAVDRHLAAAGGPAVLLHRVLRAPEILGAGVRPGRADLALRAPAGASRWPFRPPPCW